MYSDEHTDHRYYTVLTVGYPYNVGIVSMIALFKINILKFY